MSTPPLALSTSEVLLAIFSLETVYVLTGLLLFVFAALTLRDRRHTRRRGSAAFWIILGLLFLLGSRLPNAVNGLLVLAMVALDGAGRVKPSPAAEAPDPDDEPTNLPASGDVAAPPFATTAAPPVLTYAPPAPPLVRRPNRIFIPVLSIPAVTILFAVTFRLLGLDPNRGALVGLGLSGVIAMVLAVRVTGGSAVRMLDDGRRLNECMGPVNILPQLLASLGVIFAAAGVGDLVARGVVGVVPRDNLFLLVLASCAGMTAFTFVMGNTFAAFPVLAAGVLVPLIIQPFHADPAMVAILTLTVGSSGTLSTPMAANFNIVPAALLEMKNPYGVPRFQFPFALAMWPLHVLLMWGLIRWM